MHPTTSDGLRCCPGTLVGHSATNRLRSRPPAAGIMDRMASSTESTAERSPCQRAAITSEASQKTDVPFQLTLRLCNSELIVSCNPMR